MLATDYPVLDLFLTMLYFFLFVIWIWLLIMVFVDIFRSHDLNGWGKALWAIFIIILPFLGVLVYLIARGSGMQKRDVRQARAADQEMRSYIREVAATPGAPTTAEELTKLATLRDQGVLTQAEFDAQKAKLLA